MGGCGGVELLCELRLLAEQHGEGVFVFVPVLNLLAGNTALDGGFGNGRRDLGDESRIDGFGDEVVTAEGEVVHLIDVVHHVRHRLFGEVGDGIDGGKLHLLVDGGGVYVEGAAEDVGETDDVVDLVGIVGTACGHQHVGTSLHSVFVRDLRHGVGEGEDDGILGLFREHVALGESHEHVGTVDSLFQRMDIRTAGGEELLLFVEVGTTGRDDTLRVEHHNVLLLGTDGHIEFGTTDGGSTGTVDHNLHFLDVLANDLHRVLQSSGGDDGRAVLVVVHHGDVETLLQTFLDIEALRGLDVLEVDAAEGGGDAFYGLTELLRILLGHLDVEHVDATVDLEQQAFTFHDGLAAHGTDVTQSEDGGTVGDDGHEVALVGVFISCIWILLNLQTGESDTRRVGQ